MRLAIVATPALRSDQRPSPGALDGDLMRARLPLADTGFKLVDLDPSQDLAEQLEDLFDREGTGPTDRLVFYAAGGVALSGEGELFLRMEPERLEVGDSLVDVAAVFRERAKGQVLFVLECLHDGADGDGERFSAAIGAAARRAIDPAGSGIELVVASFRMDESQADLPSPFTRAIVEALDDADPDDGITAEALFEQLVRTQKLGAPALTHARGRGAFELIARARPAPRPGASRPPPEGEAESRALFEAPAGRPPGSSRSLPPPAALPRPEGAGPASVRPPAPPRPGPPQPASPRASAGPSMRPPPAPEPPKPEPPKTAAEYVASGEGLARAGDPEGALSEYRKALGVLPQGALDERAELYVRIAEIKRRQDKRREAISHFDKAVQLVPRKLPALEALIELSVEEGDWKGVQTAEERLLETVADTDARFARLLEFGERWEGRAADPARARKAYERARELRPDDASVLARLSALAEAAGAWDEVIALRRRLAELAPEGRPRAERYFELGRVCEGEIGRHDLALELFELALDAEPQMLEPLARIAVVLAERQAWKDLEAAYRRMLARAERMPEGDVRTGVKWELCRRLGLLFRDHLEDPSSALASFEDAIAIRPGDVGTRAMAANLARSVGSLEQAMAHLQAVAYLDSSPAPFHELFEIFQRTRRPDQAFHASCVTVQLEDAEARERFIFEEHKPTGLPRLQRPLRPEAWEHLRVESRDKNVETILACVANAAIGAKLAQLHAEGRLPSLDARAREDLQLSPLPVVRSFAWGSHFLGIAPPAIHVREDSDVGLTAVVAEEPTVVAGGAALRGRSLQELAFLTGRHLAYHQREHKLLLFYPTVEELSVLFCAAVKIAMPDVPIPEKVQAPALALKETLAARMPPTQLELLQVAVHELANRTRPALVRWIGAVERAATRAGYVLCGDLSVAVSLLRAEPPGVVPLEERLADLYGFAVSESHTALRRELGVAIEP